MVAFRLGRWQPDGSAARSPGGIGITFRSWVATTRFEVLTPQRAQRSLR